MTEIYTDRSRVVTTHLCPRKRLLEYQLPLGGVGGVVPIRLNMDLMVGSAFHRGVQSLLLAHHVESPVPTSVDDAVRDALEGAGDWEGYWPMVKSRGLVLGDKEDAGYVYYEQAALIEALIRGYAAFVLPQLIDRFEVVEVEREDLGTFKISGSETVVKFGMRADALLLEKDSNDLYLLSLKTTKEWGKKQEDTFRHDMQGLSEVMVVEQRLGGWHNICLDYPYTGTKESRAAKGIPEWFWKRFLTQALPTIMGIKYEFALKGRKSEYPKGSGKWSYSNPLIRPWKKSDDLGPPVWAFEFEFQDELGGNHRLGKGWRRVNVWEEEGGVKEWIEVVRTQSLQGFEPGRAIVGQFVLPVEIYRNEEDMRNLEVEIVGLEEEIHEGTEKLSALLQGSSVECPSRPETLSPSMGEGSSEGHRGSGERELELQWVLGKYFRKQTKSCDWPTKCEYQEVCFGPREYTPNPLSSELYQIRTPNHPIERDFREGMGRKELRGV